MAQCFLHGNGGANPLNFKVVGNPQPTNPKENTIWINTDTAVTGYVFSAAAPSSPTQGMVWIKTGTASQNGFNALKKNGILISPLFANQYVNGACVSKDAQIYQSGTWKKFFEPVYIIKDGVLTSSSYTWSGGTGTFKTTTQNGVSVYEVNSWNSEDPTTSTLSNILVPAGAKTFCVSYYELASYGSNPSFTIGSCSASVDRQGNIRITTPGTVKIDVTSIAGTGTTVQFNYRTAGCAGNSASYFVSMWFE